MHFLPAYSEMKTILPATFKNTPTMFMQNPTLSSVTAEKC